MLEQRPNLAELNQLQRAENGVFQLSKVAQFDYSDGQESELQLEKILSSATDLSSTSAELEAAICDWPTEYHLSSTRANLLRPLDLSGIENVLELGCGCGAISRYLGEQTGLHVDAVEGSPARASLAALRCRDLPNVSICSANFNDLEFPENHYDLVLFVGVTEYAGRFSDEPTDQQALQHLLALAKRAVKPAGVVLIAIENRLGLKYVMGACEDHYGVPDVGLADYPNSTGIRTYSRQQWQEQLSQAAFAAARFVYPFPDYKVPTLLITEDAVHSHESRTQLAEVKSRDYLRSFSLGDREGQLWQHLAATGSLADSANSFMILLSAHAPRLEQLVNFSVVAFPHKKYDWHSSSAAEKNQATPSQTAATQRLHLRAGKMQEEIEQLQAQLNLLKNSRGQRWLDKARRLLVKLSRR